MLNNGRMRADIFPLVIPPFSTSVPNKKPAGFFFSKNLNFAP